MHQYWNGLQIFCTSNRFRLFKCFSNKCTWLICSFLWRNLLNFSKNNYHVHWIWDYANPRGEINLSRNEYFVKSIARCFSCNSISRVLVFVCVRYVYENMQLRCNDTNTITTYSLEQSSICPEYIYIYIIANVGRENSPVQWISIYTKNEKSFNYHFVNYQ